MNAAREKADSDASALATVREVADYLSLSRSKLYGLMYSGQLPYVKLGKCRRRRPAHLFTTTASYVAVVDENVFPEQTNRPIRLLSPNVAVCDIGGSPQFWPSAEVKTWISLPFWTSFRWTGNAALPNSFFWLSS